jgi:hypothetical protein
MIPRLMLLAAALLTLGLAGCGFGVGQVAALQGSGNLKSESRDVHDFDRVDLGGVGTLTITQGTSEGLTIQAEDNLLTHLGSAVHGGILTLAPLPGSNLSPTKPIRYDLHVRQLRSIEVSGDADATASSLSADQLDLGVSGAGHLQALHITSSALTVDLSGSGTVTVSGQAARQSISVSGDGKYVGTDLASRQATVDVSGSGSSTVNVSEQLKATVSGSGSVRYIGSPTVQRNISGTGSVTRA